ncbi:MAG: DUF99 family protein, partial [Candidatus Nanohaloarchaea archaeon]
DGDNASDKIIKLHDSCNNPRQIKAVLIDGISLAGFNIVNHKQIAEKLQKPVITVTSNRPNREKFREAMKNSDNYDPGFEELPEYSELELSAGKIYFQHAGVSRNEAEQILEESTLQGLIPEPIRVADLIGARLQELKE